MSLHSLRGAGQIQGEPMRSGPARIATPNSNFRPSYIYNMKMIGMSYFAYEMIVNYFKRLLVFFSKFVVVLIAD